VASQIAAFVGLSLLAFGYMVRVIPNVTHFAIFDDGAGTKRAFCWGLPYAMIMAGLLMISGRGLIWGGLCRLGDASYSIYLVHPMFLLFVEYRLPPRLVPPDLLSCLCFVAVLVVGLAVHQIVEKPILAVFKNRRRIADAQILRSMGTPSAGEAVY
jgi:exopolysaccharide production protein ExoZ